MPQGPVRKRAKGGTTKRNSTTNLKRLTKPHISKKSKIPIKGKNAKTSSVDKLRKTLQKNINKSIEEEIRQRAGKYEPKPFYVIKNVETVEKKKNPKEQKSKIN